MTKFVNETTALTDEVADELDVAVAVAEEDDVDVEVALDVEDVVAEEVAEVLEVAVAVTDPVIEPWKPEEGV